MTEVGTDRFEARVNPETGGWEVHGPDGSAGWGTFRDEQMATWETQVLQRAYALGRLVGRAEKRAVEVGHGSGRKDVEHRERVTPTIAAWRTEQVEAATEGETATVTTGDATASLECWAMISGLPKDWRGTAPRRVLREVVHEQLVAAGARYDGHAKVYRGIRLR